MKSKLYLCSLALTVTGTQAHEIEVEKTQPERPNILWLSFEDTSQEMFGCYGNKYVSTPNMDSLAAHGVQYMNAWSVAPQSSPARSSLITGCYATKYGMDLHPVSQLTPEGILFPDKMREAGYYVTNNSKTHYNTTIDNKSCWNESNRKATYNSENRGENQPFFAVFNSEASHMGRMRTFHLDGRRDYTQEGIYPELLELPAHVPDLYEIRNDYAAHLEAMQDIDKWIGIFLADLKEKKLDDNTIIFVFSDHGGCLPRGKGYLFESGLRVPMIAYFPPKWEHLAGDKLQKKDESLLSFVDMAPTMLSLAGVATPKEMQGQAFLGKYKAKETKTTQFGFATNQLHHYMPMRAATDGRYKYIRNYIPYRRVTLRNYYQWGMPSNMVWDNYVMGGHNTNPDWDTPYDLLPTEMLFDLESDPSELNNLSGKKEYAKLLKKLRSEMAHHIRTTEDHGFFIPSSRTNVNIYNMTHDADYPMDELHSLVELAGIATKNDVPKLESYLISEYPDMQFWAIVGFAQLAMAGTINVAPANLLNLIDSDNPYLAAESAYACAYLGKEDMAIRKLLNVGSEDDYKVGFSLLECLSKDKSKHSVLHKYANKIKWAADNLPAEQNEDAGLMARGVLVNLGEMNIKDMYGEDAYEQGLKLNRGRRISRSAP